MFEQFLLTHHPEAGKLIARRSVKLVRHAMDRQKTGDWRGFNKMLDSDSALLRMFTGMQLFDLFSDVELLIVFVASNSTKCILRGVYECKGNISKEIFVTKNKEKLKTHFEFLKSRNVQPLGRDLFHYDLCDSEILHDHIGRLEIDWGHNTNVWVQKRLDKTICNS